MRIKSIPTSSSPNQQQLQTLHNKLQQKYLPRTCTLNLNNYHNGGWKKLLKAYPTLPKPFLSQNPIKQLNLSTNNIKDEELMLHFVGKWSGLRVLDLAQNQITKRGLALVVKEIDIKGLEQLVIFQNFLGDQGGKLVLGFTMERLRELWLGNNRITSIGLRNIKNSALVNLQILDLDTNPIGNTGIKHLTKTNFPNLTRLHLQSCNISNEGAVHLPKSNWPKLLQLGLTQNKLGMDAIDGLRNSNWPLLEFFNINNNWAVSEIVTLQLVAFRFGRACRHGLCYEVNLGPKGLREDVVGIVVSRLVEMQ